MLRREEILKQFTWGISILDAYLYFNTVNNYTDIHIISENFICDLLNILYGHHLVNANKDNKNQSGYDLIDRSDKRLFQISSTNRPAKVLESIDKALKEIDERKSRVKALEEYKSKHKFLTSEEKYYIESSKREIEKIPDNENGRICFLFLKRKAEMSEVMNYKGRDGKGYPTSDILYFDYKTDILCFDDLINRVNYLSEEENSTLRRLQSFMKNNSNLFIKREEISPSLDAVSSVIDEYADNFIAPMFLHIYKSNKDVMTLKNLYIDPKLSPILDRCGTQISEDSSVVEILDDFLWNKDEVRMLFIDGDAAIGKTSLISWICYHYKVLDDIGKAVFCGRKIICIRLRELDFDECKTSEDCILSYLKCGSIDYIETHYNDSIIILEGADELSMVQGVRASSIEQFLLDIRKIFRYHKIIITSRPKFINMQTIFEAGETVYHFFMQHFDSTMRLAWIEKYQCHEAVSKSTVTYIKEITDLEADGVADTPLALYLLVASNLSTALSSNRWNLYHEIL